MEELNASADGSFNNLPETLTSRFRIEGVLGRGGMGTVYRATHLSLDRVVALKVINPEYAANSDIAHRFAREARLMAKLRHPRAAMIYDTGMLPDGHSFIVMEYVEGKTLAQIIQDEGSLPYQKVVEIAVSICDVLAAAHSLGIIHRDLKPANVMINQNGVFVLDFGIAKMLESEKKDNLSLSMTGTGIIVGSPYYMSPEQCMGQPVEARSDLYSLGVLLYEALAGRPPFTDQTISAVIVKHATAEPPPLADLRRDVPASVIAVINQLLAKKPEDRPADAAAARALLETSLNGQTAELNGFKTRIETVAADEKATQRLNPAAPNFATNITEHINTATDVNAPQSFVAAPQSAAPNNRFRNIGIAAGLLVFAFGAVGAGALIAARFNPPVAVNNPPIAYPPANIAAPNAPPVMSHNMPMGEDFAATPASNDEKGTASIPLLSSEEADKVITKITQTTEHRADGMQIVKTPKDTALVCIHNMIEMAKTHAFAVERPNINSAWAISARLSLDVPEFHGSNWQFEPQDVDGDGFEEVIFSSPNAENTARRVVIYVPRTRQNYTILAEKDASGKTPRTTLSPNAETPNAAAFRKTLEQEAQIK